MARRPRAGFRIAGWCAPRDRRDEPGRQGFRRWAAHPVAVARALDISMIGLPSCLDGVEPRRKRYTEPGGSQISLRDQPVENWRTSVRERFRSGPCADRRCQSAPTIAPHRGQTVGGSTGTKSPQSGHTRGAQHTGSPPRSSGSSRRSGRAGSIGDCGGFASEGSFMTSWSSNCRCRTSTFG